MMPYRSVVAPVVVNSLLYYSNIPFAQVLLRAKPAQFLLIFKASL